MTENVVVTLLVRLIDQNLASWNPLIGWLRNVGRLEVPPGPWLNGAEPICAEELEAWSWELGAWSWEL